MYLSLFLLIQGWSCDRLDKQHSGSDHTWELRLSCRRQYGFHRAPLFLWHTQPQIPLTTVWEAVLWSHTGKEGNLLWSAAPATRMLLLSRSTAVWEGWERPFTNGKWTKKWREREGRRKKQTQRIKMSYAHIETPVMNVIIRYCNHILKQRQKNYTLESKSQRLHSSKKYLIAKKYRHISHYLNFYDRKGIL